MVLVQAALVALGLLAVGGGALWMVLRASGHAGGAPGTPPPLVAPAPARIAEDRTAQRQSARVVQATARSATIHHDATRLAELRLNALDATIGAQQRRKAREDHDHVR